MPILKKLAGLFSPLMPKCLSTFTEVNPQRICILRQPSRQRRPNMSDNEKFGADDEHTLPKATVFKLIQEMLPEDISCAKETKDLIVEACVEWIKLIATQSNAVCDTSSKKTISPEHVIEALRQLGFEEFVQEVEESQIDFKQSQKDRQRAQPDTNGMTEEELLALQERLFASSQARMAEQ